ncbi:MAG: hypothetical protein WD967_01560 [Candidatus Levyibacteriota bacterium]
MAKRKKTLEQKKLADMHRQVYSLNNYSPAASPRKEVQNTHHESQLTIASYLKRDILKTTILTASILSFQILLFILLKNNIVKVPFISY